ncbi:uncharacterized protein TNCV_3986211 [Trichonephila clavipes]|nr:uncharacterized protein TNCV_3986211 [Trichonephila clavipes]
MAENMTDFHIGLPSNSSMQYFPDNSPNHFRTKLSRPITLNDPPLVFTLTNNKKQLKMELKRGFDWIITPEEGNQLLRVLGLDPNKNLKIRHKPEGFTVVLRYKAPN